MTSPNRLKIHKLFDQAHSMQDLVNTSHNFATIFAAMKWEWTNWNGPDYVTFVPNHSHIFQKIKDLLIDLKIMIDKCPGPIRQSDIFYTATGRIKCCVFFEDTKWRLTVELIYNGSEFVA